MPKKPTTTPKLPTLQDFDTRPLQMLRETGEVGGAISKIIADEEAADIFHHQMVRLGICARFGLALAIAEDPSAFANFRKDARIKALPRPPQVASDTLRSLFQATYPDPKKASKYYKRIEPMWSKRWSPAELLGFLEKNGVSSPAKPANIRPGKLGPRKNAPSTPSKAKEPPRAMARTSGNGNGDRVSSPATNGGEAPCGSFHFWPGLKVGKDYDLRVTILEEHGEMTLFDLQNVSPA